MADVASRLASWNTDPTANQPTGSTIAGGGIDDNLRQIQATIRADLASIGSDIQISQTIDVSAAGSTFNIQGPGTITGFISMPAGIRKRIRLNAAVTLTHNATTFFLPGQANISAVAGDIADFESQGNGNWICTHFISPTRSTLLNPSLLEIAAFSRTNPAPGNFGAMMVLSQSLNKMLAQPLSNLMANFLLAVDAPTARSVVPPFDSGTRMVFAQGFTPTGWTRDTNPTYQDRFMRIVTTTPTSAGGSEGVSAFQGQARAVTATQLTQAQMPSHVHAYNDPGHAHNFEAVFSGAVASPGGSAVGGSDGFGVTQTAFTQISITATGGDQPHGHNYSMNFAYYDVIIGVAN